MRMSDTDTEQWLRIAELFDAAVELSPGAREEFIVARCADDAALAERLRAMLAADAAAESEEFLDTPIATADITDWRADEDAYVPGTRRFGAYRLIRPIGRGGMGEVHLAERSDGEFEQRVALKLLPTPTPGLVRRFRRERQILARLEHPNIAHLFDGGGGENNVPFFAMEYVDGEPITRYAAARKLDVRAVLQLFLPVCDAVQYAHRNLVVHRDIKPSNVFVGADGVPKLLDFGIAKLLQTSLDDELTRTAARAFTPDYAAPEQILGGAITTAADIYALGVVLYELLTGTRPYRLKRDQLLEQAILAMEPMTPSQAVERTAGDAEVRRQRRVLRGDLDRIVLTALAKEPERRYPSVEAFAADIRRWLDGRPVAARGDGALYRMRKFILRNKGSAAAAAAALAALVAATVISLEQAHRARAEAASARALQSFMLNVFTQAEPWRNAGHQPTALDLAKASLAKIDAELADEPLARFDMYMGLQRLFSVADDVRLSVTAAARAVETARALPYPDPERLQRAQSSLGHALLYNGDYDGAEKTLAALASQRAASDAIRLGVAALQTSLARERGRREEHLRLARASQALGDELGRGEKERRAQLWHVTDALDRLGDYRAALPLVIDYETRSAALYEPAAATRNDDVAWLLHVAGELDAPRAALLPFSRMLARERGIFGASDYTVNALLQAAQVARAAGRSSAALDELAEVRAILDRIHPDPIEIAGYESGLGLVLLDRADAEAASHLEAAAAIYRKVGGDGDPRLLATRAASAALKKSGAALVELREIHATQAQRNLRETPETAVWLANARIEAGATDEAVALLRDALQRLDAQGRPVSATAFRTHRALARALADGAGPHREADAEARLALAQALALFGDDDVQASAAARTLPFDDAGDLQARIASARQRAAQLDRPALHLVDLATAALDRAEQAETANETRGTAQK